MKSAAKCYAETNEVLESLEEKIESSGFIKEIIDYLFEKYINIAIERGQFYCSFKISWWMRDNDRWIRFNNMEQDILFDKIYKILEEQGFNLTVFEENKSMIIDWSRNIEK